MHYQESEILNEYRKYINVYLFIIIEEEGNFRSEQSYFVCKLQFNKEHAAEVIIFDCSRNLNSSLKLHYLVVTQAEHNIGRTLLPNCM